MDAVKAVLQPRHLLALLVSNAAVVVVSSVDSSPRLGLASGIVVRNPEARSMRCRFAPVACAVILALVTPQRGDGADTPEHLAYVTLESQKEWAAARGCSVTADASKTLISKMSAFGETIERR